MALIEELKNALPIAANPTKRLVIYLKEQNKKIKPDADLKKGIPEVLWSEEDLHRMPYEGDNGVVFSPKPVNYEALQSILEDLGDDL